GEGIKTLEAKLAAVEARCEEILLYAPNIPHASTPDGAGPDDNPVVNVWGEKPRFDFSPRDHVDVGAKLGIFDWERAAKISGSRFSVLRGHGARLPRALMQLMLDTHSSEHGYTEIWPPALIKDSAMRGTGQLPKFADDAFRIQQFEEGETA